MLMMMGTVNMNSEFDFFFKVVNSNGIDLSNAYHYNKNVTILKLVKLFYIPSLQIPHHCHGDRSTKPPPRIFHPSYE